MASIQNWQSREDTAKEKGSDYPEGQYPEPIKKFLFGRGLVDSEIIQNLFQPKLTALKNPMSIIDMEKSVDRLIRAFQNKEMICLYADFDLDGTSGLALLSEGLKGIGFENLILHQPKRLADGYGFHAWTVEELAQKNVQLIVTIDVGITAFQAVVKAKELNIDVIVTDHHQAEEKLPDAFAVVNPNRKDDQSGLNYLCGAGVAFYLLRALMKKMSEQNLLTKNNQFDLKSVLDFFTIGTITDMVPLVEDNRTLTKYGLVQLSQTQRPGLRTLLDELGFAERELNAQDVGIRFAPKLNALSRMEKGILPIDILLEKNLDLAKNKIEFVMNNNDERVATQGDGEKEALEALASWEHEDFFYFSSKNIHRGVAGLIATKLCQVTGKPSFIGSELEDDRLIVGSARIPQKYSGSVLNALKHAEKNLNRFGGHHAASGFELFVSSKENLIQALDEFFTSKESHHANEILDYDFDLQFEHVSSGLMKWIDALGPFGQGFPSPVFRIRDVNIEKVFQLRGGHLRLSFADQEKKIEALYFSPPMNFELKKNDRIDMLVEMQWNYYQGKQSVQLQVKDIQKNI